MPVGVRANVSSDLRSGWADDVAANSDEVLALRAS